MKTVISTSKAPAAIGPYSQAIRKGDTLYLSGQIGMVPATGELVSDDVKEQTAQALANMKAILAEAGATPADVTKVTVFIVGTLSDIDVIVTDVRPPEEWLERFERAKVDCVYPDKEDY